MSDLLIVQKRLHSAESSILHRPSSLFTDGFMTSSTSQDQRAHSFFGAALARFGDRHRVRRYALHVRVGVVDWVRGSQRRRKTTLINRYCACTTLARGMFGFKRVDVRELSVHAQYRHHEKVLYEIMINTVRTRTTDWRPTTPSCRTARF